MFEAILLTTLPALKPEEVNMLLIYVSPEKQERIRRFHVFRDAQNTLLADILARTEICRLTGLSNHQLIFSTNEYGKPFLATDPHVHYNLSHSGAYVALVIGDQPVGIDVEEIKSIDLKIAERFYAPDERDFVFSQPEHLRLTAFFEIWTKKESRTKWEGKGLHKPLPSFSVFDNAETTGLYYHKMFQTDDAICHVCSAQKRPPHCRFIDMHTLTARLL